MDSDVEEICWVPVNNAVTERMVDLSLIHKLVPGRKLRKRTRILNSQLKKIHDVRSYSHYVQMKTSVLRHFPADTDSDDDTSFTDEDYRKIYKSEESTHEYLRHSKSNADWTCLLESDDDDYITLSQSNITVDDQLENISLGWQSVLKKKTQRSNQTTREPKVNSSVTVKKKKKVSKEIGERQSLNVQKKIKKAFSTKQSCNNNNTLRNENNTGIMDEEKCTMNDDSMDDVPLNQRSQSAPNTECNESRISDSGLVSKTTVSDKPGSLNVDQLSKSSEISVSAESKIQSDNQMNKMSVGADKPACDSQIIKTNVSDSLHSKVSQDSKGNKIKLTEGMELKQSDEGQSDKCTIDKDSNKKKERISPRKCVKKCLSEKKKVCKSAIKENGEVLNGNLVEDTPRSNKSEAADNVKKNLMGSFNNFSLISGNQNVELQDNSISDNIDLSRSQLRLSDINPLSRSTPLSIKTVIPEALEPISENQPKDSGIDEDSQEEQLENSKVERHKRIVINHDTSNVIPESSESEDSADISDEPTLIINEDISNQESDNEQGKILDDTLIMSNSTEKKEEEDVQYQKHQPKVMCTEIVNKKYKIITAKQQEEKLLDEKVSEQQENQNTIDDKSEVSMTDIQKDCQSMTNKEEISQDQLGNSIDDNTSDISNKLEKDLDTKEQVPDDEQDSENPDEMMSVTSKKRIQQLKRLDLTADSSSDDDEDFKSQEISQHSVPKNVVSKDVLDQQESQSTHDDKIDISVTGRPEDCQNKDIDTKEQQDSDDEQDSENPDEMMSVTSKKRIQQLKRLDLTADSSSDDDQDYNVYKSQKSSQHSATKDESEEDSDEEDNSHVSKAPTVKTITESEKSPTKEPKEHSPQPIPQDTVDEIKNKEEQDNPSVLNTTHGKAHSSSDESKAESAQLSKSVSASEQKLHTSICQTNTYPKEKHAHKDIATGNETTFEHSQTQTNVHIPAKAILKRPSDLQEYIQQEELVPNEISASFSRDKMSDSEIFVMEVPKRLFNTELSGQKIILTKNKLKLGKEKYRAMYKDTGSITCILGSNESGKTYETVWVKPAGIIVTQAKLNGEISTAEPQQEVPDSFQPEYTQEETQSTLFNGEPDNSTKKPIKQKSKISKSSVKTQEKQKKRGKSLPEYTQGENGSKSLKEELNIDDLSIKPIKRKSKLSTSLKTTQEKQKKPKKPVPGYSQEESKNMPLKQELNINKVTQKPRKRKAQVSKSPDKSQKKQKKSEESYSKEESKSLPLKQKLNSDNITQKPIKENSDVFAPQMQKKSKKATTQHSQHNKKSKPLKQKISIANLLPKPKKKKSPGTTSSKIPKEKQKTPRKPLPLKFRKETETTPLKRKLNIDDFAKKSKKKKVEVSPSPEIFPRRRKKCKNVIFSEDESWS